MSDRQTSTIQVDMFDVQLGAALLLQFRNNDGHVVRVLADAGVDPKSGYAQNHVLAPLKQAMKDFDGANPRLDLIIGTHYDADHLEGLIPIINDRSIDISEAWMPPVANDTVSHSLDDEPEERELLAKQFDSDDGSAVLQNYFHSKLRDCEYLQALQRAAEELAENGDRALRRGHQEVERWSERTRDDWINAFRQHFDEAATAFQPSEVHTHADDPIQTLIDLTQGVASDDNLDMS